MLVYISIRMRLTPTRSLPLVLSTLILLPVCLSQTSAVQVGDGASTPTIREEFLAAYQRGDFFSTVALPPLTEVVSYGSGGFRQEFQDPAKSGIRSALIRPAVPDLTLGVNNAVRQVRQPIYSVYTQSSIGVSTAGFPSMDTTRFQSGYYQTFDRGFGIFVWDQAPVNGTSDTRFNVIEPIFTRWKAVGLDAAGAPIMTQTAATTRYSTTGNFQVFTSGGFYSITNGGQSGRVFYLRPAVQALYEQRGGPSGILGYPVNDETVLADGRRRQSFEGGTMEYALNGAPVLKNALQAISVVVEDPIRLTAGQTVSLSATLQTIAGEIVTDRDVFWTTSNGRVALITGTGPRVTLRGVAGGTAIITATSEGKTSNRITVQVSSQCCAIGEGAPTAAMSQTFTDAIARNRITVRTPVATPVRRVGAGYVQEAIALPSGNRIVIAKADASPVAYVISGATLTSFDALGSFGGALGYPTGDLSAGQTQRFEFGALAGSPVRLVAGAILTRWLALGADAGVLGPPLTAVTAQITFTGTPVSLQVFRAGYAFQYDSGALAGRAFITSGAIAARHLELGLAAGQIGAPMTDEFLGANGYRQEFEGAYLEYNAGGPVRVIDKTRRPSVTITPASVLPGGRYRVAIGGFPAGARLRLTQVSGTSQDGFDATAGNGSYVWESVVPSNARAGVVIVRAVDAASATTTAEGTYTVRTLAELRPALSKISGDSQAGAPTVILPAPLRVVLRDSSGNPLSGVALRFEASPGAAILSATPVTGPDGTGEAHLRLPASAGIVLASVEAGGQLVTFNARSQEQVISDFPRVVQAVDGNLGNSNLPLAQKGSLVAALAGVMRFFQQRGVAPSDYGLADTAALNTFLRPVSDGFLNVGATEDPQPNPFRATEFVSGALSSGFIEPTVAAIREAFMASGPIIVGLELTRNGQASGTHFVTVIGILADGDLMIADPNPQVNLARLGSYLGGFPYLGSTWRGAITAGLQLAARPAPPAFYAFSTTAFHLNSPSAGCSPVANWSASFANFSATASGTRVFLGTCDGTAGSYQAALPTAPFLLTVVGLTQSSQRTFASAADPTAYRISRDASDAWVLSSEHVSFDASAVLNAASFTGQLGAGAIITIFGQALPVATTAGSDVQLDGRTLPILFSNGFQLNAALPADVSAGRATLTIRSGGSQETVSLQLLDTAPGLFTLDAQGSAAALNADSSLNTQANPATRGQALVLFATGLGAVSTRPDGLSWASAPVNILIGGRELTPFYAGLAPGFIGLYQVNVALPGNLPPGLGQTVLLRSGGRDSNAGRISIR